MRVALAGFALMVMLAGCAGTPPEAVSATDFEPLRFFEGRATSRGTITTAFVLREDFTARFEGHAEKETLRLDERFSFADGERLQRWNLRFPGGGRCEGTVETEGRYGKLHASVPVACRLENGGLDLDYDGYAPGGDTRLRFRHRMVLQADGRVLNRVRISRFGLPLAGARVVFERVSAGEK